MARRGVVTRAHQEVEHDDAPGGRLAGAEPRGQARGEARGHGAGGVRDDEVPGQAAPEPRGGGDDEQHGAGRGKPGSELPPGGRGGALEHGPQVTTVAGLPRQDQRPPAALVRPQGPHRGRQRLHRDGRPGQLPRADPAHHHVRAPAAGAGQGHQQPRELREGGWGQGGSGHRSSVKRAVRVGERRPQATAVPRARKVTTS